MFLQSEFFLTVLNFLEEDTNIYFECVTLFEKKIFTDKNKIFVKVIDIFFLNIYIIFQIVLLHLNNHSWSYVRNIILFETGFSQRLI